MRQFLSSILLYFILLTSTTKAQASCALVLEAISGLYQSIPVSSNWNYQKFDFKTSQVKLSSFSRGDWTRVTTDIDSYGQPIGRIERTISADKKKLVLENARLKYVSGNGQKAPDFIQRPGVISLVDERGVPTLTFVTIQQMKLLGVEYGTLEKVFINDLTNIETAVQLKNNAAIAKWMSEHPYENVPGRLISDAIMATTTGRYLNTLLTQSGHRIKKIKAMNSSVTRISKSTRNVEVNDLLASYDSETLFPWHCNLEIDVAPIL